MIVYKCIILLFLDSQVSVKLVNQLKHSVIPIQIFCTNYYRTYIDFIFHTMKQKKKHVRVLRRRAILISIST